MDAMAASIRMDDQLLQRLKRYAQAHDLSASSIVREALTRYLDDHQQTAFEMGADLFGRHCSGAGVQTRRSVERKAHLRARVHGKRRPG
jgi:predicted DNA-binding protein